MCARALNRADAERERCVRALGEKTSRSSGSTGDSQKLGLGTFLKGKKSLKGSAMLLSWQHCISISPTTGWATGQTENTRCVNRALKKLVPLK